MCSVVVAPCRLDFLKTSRTSAVTPAQVVADELVSAGHEVKHIDSTGRTEDHVPLGPKRKLPDFIVARWGRKIGWWFHVFFFMFNLEVT